MYYWSSTREYLEIRQSTVAQANAVALVQPRKHDVGMFYIAVNNMKRPLDFHTTRLMFVVLVDLWSAI